MYNITTKTYWACKCELSYDIHFFLQSSKVIYAWQCMTLLFSCSPSIHFSFPLFLFLPFLLKMLKLSPTRVIHQYVMTLVGSCPPDFHLASCQCKEAYKGDWIEYIQLWSKEDGFTWRMIVTVIFVSSIPEIIDLTSISWVCIVMIRLSHFPRKIKIKTGDFPLVVSV